MLDGDIVGQLYLQSFDSTISGNEEIQSLEKDDNNEKIYWPNCDTSIWLRSCKIEVIEPIEGTIIGKFPNWLRGTLWRNGPGSLMVGRFNFEHLFDGSALLHRFEIVEEKITYQNRFVQTDVYKRNQAGQRIVYTEFGTRGVPDPCQSIFQRVSSFFNSMENMSDNSMISIYPFGDEYYTLCESGFMHRIDPETLETKGKVDLTKNMGIVNHTSHPHITKDGTIYNMGMSMTSRGPFYNVVSFSPKKITLDYSDDEKKQSIFDEAKIVASIPCRWKLNPSYMHTFGITDNYFVVIEQPLAVSLTGMVKCIFRNEPLATCLKWHENENTFIHVISRKTNRVEKTFVSERFFFLHIINQYETVDEASVVLDVCCYRDSKMLDCMYIDVLKNIHKNPDYAQLFRGRPLRFVLPMKQTSDCNVIDDEQRFIKDCLENDCRQYLRQKASARVLSGGKVFVKPELLCDLGCETPRIHYESYLGKQYRYFYAISSDVDLDNPGTLIKVDTVNKTRKTWSEKNVYPSEPIFVPDPNGENEDSGVVVSALVWGQERKTEVGMLILDAESFTEIARANFDTPGPVPKCLHGWFSLNKK